MRTSRIVQRRNQREELANLKAFVKACQPLVAADARLRQAFSAGYQQRLKEEIEEAKKKEQEKEDASDVIAAQQAIDEAKVEGTVPFGDITEEMYRTNESLEQPLEPSNSTHNERQAEANQ